MVDVKFYEVFDEEKQSLKTFLPTTIKTEFSAKTIQESGDTKPVSRLISIRTQSVIPNQWGKEIAGILSRSQGFDHLKTYQENNSVDIPLGYLGKYCSRAVAEHAVMVSLNLIKKTNKQISQFKLFDRDQLTGLQASGRRALVVGVGSIGQDIVKIAKAMGMEVKGVDIEPKTDDIEYLPLEEGIQWAEIVYCAAPLTKQTNGLLNYSLFKSVGASKFLINISRGEITPIEDMNKLLEEKVLAGLGLDVFEKEPYLADTLRMSEKLDDPYINLILKMNERNDVIFTPHNAFNTVESLEEKSRNTVIALTEFLDKGAFPHQI